MDSTPSLWSSLGSLAGVLGGLSVLWGAWLNWRREPAAARLITVQAESTEATTGKTRAETESLAVGSLEKALIVAERALGKVERDRDYWRERAEAAEARIGQLLEEQKERHKMANDLHAYTIKWALLDEGIPFEQVKARRIEPIYPEAEGD